MSNEAAEHPLHIATPISAAPPSGSRPQALGRTIAKRLTECGIPHCGQWEQGEPGGAIHCFSAAIPIGLYERITHLVTEVSWIQPEQESEPALGCVY